MIVKGFTKSIPKKPSEPPGFENSAISASCQGRKVQQFTSETPEQILPNPWLCLKNLKLPHCREQILGVNEQAVRPWGFVLVDRPAMQVNVCRAEIL
jgi:hypothetical protein